MEKIKKRILVLGGAGMLGHILLKKLYSKDIFEIFDITRKKDNRLNNFECDVTNFNSLFKIIKDI